MQEDGPASGAFVLSNPVAPALQAFPRVSNTYGSYQVAPTPVGLLPLMEGGTRKCLIAVTAWQDANIPFPRTSGARFCGTGCLVYFTRPISMHRSATPTEPTPR